MAIESQLPYAEKAPPLGPARVAVALVRMGAVALVAGWLAYEWRRWPDGTELLGPLGIVWYNGPTADSLACCVVGLALLLAYPLRPSVLTAGLSLFGLALWVFFGVLAKGIGC